MKHKLTLFRMKSLIRLFVLLLPFIAIPSHAIETITYYHTDSLGSPVAGTDTSGALLWKEDYKPYGERIRKQVESDKNTCWFTGHPEDKETGLTYAGARFYDSVTGRFLAIDPVGFSEDNLQMFNRYAYGNNNPYKYVDPDGKANTMPCRFCGGGTSLGGGPGGRIMGGASSSGGSVRAPTAKIPRPDGGFSANLSKTKAKSRTGHTNAGNKQLNDKMKMNPFFRKKSTVLTCLIGLVQVVKGAETQKIQNGIIIVQIQINWIFALQGIIVRKQDLKEGKVVVGRDFIKSKTKRTC